MPPEQLCFQTQWTQQEPLAYASISSGSPEALYQADSLADLDLAGMLYNDSALLTEMSYESRSQIDVMGQENFRRTDDNSPSQNAEIIDPSTTSVDYSNTIPGRPAPPDSLEGRLENMKARHRQLSVSRPAPSHTMLRQVVVAKLQDVTVAHSVTNYFVASAI